MHGLDESCVNAASQRPCPGCVVTMDTKTPLRGILYGGSASCIAEALTIPVDVLKVRMQLQGGSGAQRLYHSSADAVAKIARDEGLLAFTKGIKPAVLRQMTYGSLRFGLYPRFKEAFGVVRQSMDSQLFRKLGAAAVSGACAAFVCSPLDLIKVRMQADGMRCGCMQADGMRPSVEAPRYRGVHHVAATVLRQQGVLGLWTGVMPTTYRAAVVAAAEIGSYDEVKSALLRHGLAREGVKLHFATAMCSGFIATAASSPFDVVKARVMSQPRAPSGAGMLYSGPWDCFAKSFQAEGLRFAYRGFWPNYMCKGPTVVLLFLIYEQVQALGDRWLDGQ